MASLLFKLVDPILTTFLGGIATYFVSRLKVIVSSDKTLECKKDARLEWPLVKEKDDSPPQALGLDCEMVGVGRGGSESQLARVTLVRSSTPAPTKQEDFEVVYDAIVKPVKKVSDYRTKYSGINKEILRDGLPGVPLVSFDEAKEQVGQLIFGKIVVGHALVNDFNVLHLRHPRVLTRDTALYPPFMSSQGKKKTRRMMQRKLKYIVEEELGGWRIQTGGAGHCSAEDAAGALGCYLKRQAEWEKSVGSGAVGEGGGSSTLATKKLFDLVLDGSNMPIGIHRGDKGEIKVRSRVVDDQGDKKARPVAGQTKYAHVDYLPCLKELMKKNVRKVMLFWDGSGVKEWKEFDQDGEERNLDGITLRVTKVGVEADDVIVDEMKTEESQYKYEELESVTVEECIESLSNPEDFTWFIVKRTSGGSKCHKKLFNKLNLRRPSEGACCFVPLNEGSRKFSLGLCRRLKHDKVMKQRLVEIKRVCGVSRWPKRVVVTDDVLLAERVVQEGGCVIGGRAFVEVM